MYERSQEPKSGVQWSWGGRVLIWCCLTYAVVFAWLVFRRGGLPLLPAFWLTCQIAPPIVAGACSLAFVKSARVIGPTHRLAWRLIGWAGFAFALGLLILHFLHDDRRPLLSLPVLSDLAFLSIYPFLVAATILLLSAARIPRRGRLLIDSALVAGSIGILIWYFIGQRLWYDRLPWLEKMVSLAYPFGDALLLAGALLLIRGATARRELHHTWLCLAGGLALMALADIAFSFERLGGSASSDSWPGWLWSASWLGVGYAALVSLWSQSELPVVEVGADALGTVQIEDHVRWFFSVLAPYLAVAMAFVIVIAHDYATNRAINNPLFIVGFGLVLLVVAGELLNLLETQRWAAELRSFNTNLEEMVARRTGQLGALHRLSKAINNTLQTDQVLSAAAEHTRQALHAEAVALWLKGHAPDEPPRFQIYPEGALQLAPDTLQFLAGLPDRDRLEIIALPTPSGYQSHQDTANYEGQSLNGYGESESATALRRSTRYSGFCLRAPLLWQGQSGGVIGVIRQGSTFDSTESVLLENIGLEVGTALENAHRYEAALEAADRDSVTGLLNHRAIHQRLDIEFERLSGQNRPLSVIMMDLNNFKLFNDVYGHPVGDQVLKKVARLLREECRKFDILGRYGGDEFIAILPDTDTDTALKVAQILHERTLQEGFLPPGDDRTIPVTLSFGIAAFPLDSTNRHELITIADANLYAAKQSEEAISRTSEAQRERRELHSSEGSFDILDAIVTAVDNKDRYTRHHSEDVTQYALWIAEELGFSEETLRVTRVGGLLHDVGKIGVPEDILRKPQRLTPGEYEAMKYHPQLGALIVGGVPGMEGIVDAVRYHHERWDGDGYPTGLAGEEIPLLGRILAVADAFSAMTTTRPYRKALSWDAALREIEGAAGSQFDPMMASAFVTAAHKYYSNQN